VLPATLLLAACTTAGNRADVPALAYRGELEFYLEPYDAKGACSATVGLRNVSGVRQAEAWLDLAWYGADGALLTQGRLRLDPLLPGRYDAKNMTVPGQCADVQRVEVRRATWTVFEAEPAPMPPLATIEGAAGGQWQFRWQADDGLFVGQALSGDASSTRGSVARPRQPGQDSQPDPPRPTNPRPLPTAVPEP
jgi:hypothetical protein